VADDGRLRPRYAAGVTSTPEPLHHIDASSWWSEPQTYALITLLVGARLRIEGADGWTFVALAVSLGGLLLGYYLHRIIGSAVVMAAAIGGAAVEASADPATGLMAAAAIYLVTVEGPRVRAHLLGAGFSAVFIVALLFLQSLSLSEFVRNLAPLLVGFASGHAIWYRRSVLAEARERAYLAEVARDEEARLRVQEERIRIARDLHDIVGHSLSIINVQAGVAAHVISDQPDVAGKALEEIQQASHQALEELRMTVGVLRSRSEDGTDLAPSPRLDDLDRLISSFREAGLPVEFHRASDEPEMGPARQLAVYRIVQEALTNVVRHGGSGATRISLVYPPGEVSIEISNDGDPVEPVEGLGQGLVGMRERVAALAGSINISPRPEGGFQVHARFPIGTP